MQGGGSCRGGERGPLNGSSPCLWRPGEGAGTGTAVFPTLFPAGAAVFPAGAGTRMVPAGNGAAARMGAAFMRIVGCRGSPPRSAVPGVDPVARTAPTCGVGKTTARRRRAAARRIGAKNVEREVIMQQHRRPRRGGLVMSTVEDSCLQNWIIQLQKLLESDDIVH